MATLTWTGLNAPPDWTDTADWEIGTTSPAGPPGPGDTALVGAFSLETSLSDLTVDFQKASGDATIDATNVDLGADLKFFVTNPFDNTGGNIYRVIGSGTLDATNTLHLAQPMAGSIDFSAAPLTIDLAPGATFVDSGSIGGVGLTIAADASGVFENNSTIVVTGAFQLKSGATLEGGVVDLMGNSAQADITGAVTAGSVMAFTGQTNPGVLDGELTIENLPTFQGTVVLARENAIALPGVDSGEASYDGSLLTLDNGDTIHVSLGAGAGSLFVLPESGVTTIFAEAACFAAGTRISTETGETPVEALRAGDRVRLARGGGAKVVWMGVRDVACDRHPKPHDVWPVQVSAGAFAPGQPARDLFLSPDHAVFTRGVLIPIRYLVNAATIAQRPVATVRYYHVELARHDVLLAEGLPAESYLDTGNRAGFGNAAVADLQPQFAVRALDVWAREACAPLVLDGPVLVAERRRLLRRAATIGARRSRDPALCLRADGVLVPITREGDSRHVRLPVGTRRLRFCSRSWVPVQMRPDAADARRLGVAIDRLWLGGREVALDHPGFAGGWHAVEDRLRWTDGDAELLLDGERQVAFRIALTGVYWLEEPAARLTRTG